MALSKAKHFIIPILASAILTTSFSQMAAASFEIDTISNQEVSFIPRTANKINHHGAIEFENLKVEYTGFSILPGTYDLRIQSIKETLAKYDLVSHTQMRGDNLNFYDGKLVVLIHTLSDFCSYTPENDQIDDSMLYIINNLKELSPEMLEDIRLAYKQNLVVENKDGTIGYDGTTYPYYLFTQTDPEWASDPYGNKSDGSMAASACGPTAMSTIVSSYLHEEILPTEVADFSVSRGHRYPTGTATSLFSDAASHYGLPAPVEVFGQSIDEIYQGIRDNGHMAIALMGNGCFTSSGHYVVLVGTEERDGKEYFLVADPNYPNRSYSRSNELIDEDPHDSFVLASKSVIARQTKGITWFKNNFKNVAGNFQTNRTEILLADYSDDEFRAMIPVAVSQIVTKDTLYQIAENNQNDSYARNPLAIPNSSEVYASIAAQVRLN